jgi:menaquinone-dependent protoporphyrinogen oxidase
MSAAGAAARLERMPNILVVHASTHGHTRRIAERIAQIMRADGADVSLERADAAPAPMGYDAVVVGASIHAGHHQREIVEWASRHRTGLGMVPTAFFTVCLTAADDADESRAATRRYLDEFVEATGWTPDRATTFAGALQYREYDFMTRLLMRLLMHKGHHPTDTSRDYDYTDWNAVEQFAHECAAAPACAQCPDSQFSQGRPVDSP